MSYQELALTQNIYNSSLIARLVSDFKKIGKVPPNRKKAFADSQGRLLTHKLYLDPFMDIYNGEIISYDISKTPSAENIMEALYNAIKLTVSCQYR